LNPASVVAYFNRALVWCERGEWARAVADYDRAIALDPRHADAHCNRGLARLRQSRPEEARQDFDRCLALDPNLRQSLERLVTKTKRQQAERPAVR
jgi:tetratricopeptide (TPR) repeat protein